MLENGPGLTSRASGPILVTPTGSGVGKATSKAGYRISSPASDGADRMWVLL